MASPSRVGTPDNVQVDGSGAQSGSASITVPTDCNLIVAFWCHWDGNSSSTLSTLSIDGDSFLAAEAELAEGATTNEAGVGIAVLANPSTGSQTISWGWSGSGGARSEGGEIRIVYLQDGNTADPVRAAGVDAAVSSTVPSTTVDTDTTDLFLAFGESFSVNPTLELAGAAPETTFVDNASLNSHFYDLGEDTSPPSTSIAATVASGSTAYSAVAGISLKESAPAAVASRLLLLGVG